MTVVTHTTKPTLSASTVMRRRADALREATIIAEANGSYHNVKSHTGRFAGKLIRKYGFARVNELINGAYRTSDLRQRKHGKPRPGNRNHHVECDYRDFLKSLRKSCKSLRRAYLRRLVKRMRSTMQHYKALR